MRAPSTVSSVDATVSPPTDMIRRLTLALSHVGERLEVRRTAHLVRGGGTSSVEGRVLGSTTEGDRLWVWVDGHVVKFSSPHLDSHATPDASIGDLVGTRRESPSTLSMYDISYSTPLIGTTANRNERIQRSVPLGVQRVPGLVDLVVSMLQ